MPLDKRELLQQMRRAYERRLANALRAELDAADAARTAATEAEKKEDGRAALEFGSLARGQGQRSQAARAELEQLEALCRRELPVFKPTSPVALLALVDVLVTSEDGEDREQTLLVMPFGAGTQLTGPGGDGFLSVITPASPVGRALVGRHAGDSIEVQLPDGVCEVRVLEVS